MKQRTNKRIEMPQNDKQNKQLIKNKEKPARDGTENMVNRRRASTRLSRWTYGHSIMTICLLLFLAPGSFHCFGPQKNKHDTAAFRSEKEIVNRNQNRHSSSTLKLKSGKFLGSNKQKNTQNQEAISGRSCENVFW